MANVFFLYYSAFIKKSCHSQELNCLIFGLRREENNPQSYVYMQMVLLQAAVRRFQVFRPWCEQCRTFTWCWSSFPLLQLSVHLSVIRWSAAPPCGHQNKHKHFICSFSDGFEVPSLHHEICNFSFTLTLWTLWKVPIYSVQSVE